MREDAAIARRWRSSLQGGKPDHCQGFTHISIKPSCLRRETAHTPQTSHVGDTNTGALESTQCLTVGAKRKVESHFVLCRLGRLPEPSSSLTTASVLTNASDGMGGTAPSSF